MSEPSSLLTTIRDRFIADHRRLEALFDPLLDAFERNAQGEIRRLWTVFEQRLTRHMDAEDKFVLPAFERSHTDATARVRADHSSFRRDVAKLGVGVDLRLVRASAANAFIARLREHSVREDALLYPWSDKALGDLDKAALLRAIEPL